MLKRASFSDVVLHFDLIGTHESKSFTVDLEALSEGDEHSTEHADMMDLMAREEDVELA